MITFTRADMISWEPCMSETTVRRLARGLPRRCTALGVLRAEHISPADRLWVVLRPECIPERTLRLFACDCARRALTRERDAGREPDPRSWAAVDVAEMYARGDATDAELAAAGAAAWAAAWAAETAAQVAALAAMLEEP